MAGIRSRTAAAATTTDAAPSRRRAAETERRRSLRVVRRERRRRRLGAVGAVAVLIVGLVIVSLNIVLINGQRSIDRLENEITTAQVRHRELQAELGAVLSPAEVDRRIAEDGRFIRAEDVPEIPAGGPIVAPGATSAAVPTTTAAPAGDAANGPVARMGRG